MSAPISWRPSTRAWPSCGQKSYGGEAFSRARTKARDSEPNGRVGLAIGDGSMTILLEAGRGGLGAAASVTARHLVVTRHLVFQLGQHALAHADVVVHVIHTRHFRGDLFG